MEIPIIAMPMILFPRKSEHDSLQPLFDCLDHFKLWMGYSFQNLNENKTEDIMFGSSSASSVLGIFAPYQKPVVKEPWGVV